MMLSSHVTAPGEARFGLNPYQDDDVNFSRNSSGLVGLVYTKSIAKQNI
jgi:hypothetical protein